MKVSLRIHCQNDTASKMRKDEASTSGKKEKSAAFSFLFVAPRQVERQKTKGLKRMITMIRTV
jgi:hypothetical protein